jgi:Tfp pilus assembly protein PilP
MGTGIHSDPGKAKFKSGQLVLINDGKVGRIDSLGVTMGEWIYEIGEGSYWQSELKAVKIKDYLKKI